MRLAERLLRMPGLCAVCRSWGTGRLCAPCTARWGRARPRCPRCALRVPHAGLACGTCATLPPGSGHGPDRAVAAVDYAFPWDRLLLQFKFHGASDLAGALADRLREAVARGAGARTAPFDGLGCGSGAGAGPVPDTSTVLGPRSGVRETARVDGDDPVARQTAPALVLPVPLGPQRLRERGFNQSWELARRLGLPACPHTLLRVRDGPHQLALPEARRAANVRGAFAVHPARRAALAGRHVAVVDDVMTSGATARAVSQVLREAGVASVAWWVIARTPAPGD